MEDKLFLIAIGGTGMRCLEAFVHLCAAGLFDNHFGYNVQNFQIIVINAASILYCSFEEFDNISQTASIISEVFF